MECAISETEAGRRTLGLGLEPDHLESWFATLHEIARLWDVRLTLVRDPAGTRITGLSEPCSETCVTIFGEWGWTTFELCLEGSQALPMARSLSGVISSVAEHILLGGESDRG